MKHSSTSERRGANAMPSTRRDALKKGLGLTVGTAATGMGGLLVAPAVAEAANWGPWHTIYDDGSLVQLMLKTFPKYFNSITKTPDTSSTTIIVYWRNSASAMTKQGKICVANSSNQRGAVAETEIAFFQFDTYYDKYGYKDLVDGTLYCKELPIFFAQIFSSEELRRRLTSKNSNPFNGIIGTIFSQWQASASNDFNVNIAPNQFINIRGFRRVVIADVPILSSGSILFDASLSVLEGGVWTQTPYTPIRVDYMMGGGNGLHDWQRLSYVSLPEVASSFNYLGSTGWNTNLSQQSGIGALQNPVYDIFESYRELELSAAITENKAVLQTGWNSGSTCAAAILAAAIDGAVSPTEGSILGALIGGALVGTYWAYDSARHANNSKRGLYNVQMVTAMTRLIDFFGSSWNTSPRNTAKFDLADLLRKYPRP